MLRAAQLKGNANALALHTLAAYNAGRKDEALLLAMTFCHEYGGYHPEAYDLCIHVLEQTGHPQVALAYHDKMVDKYTDHTERLERALRAAWKAEDAKRAQRYGIMLRHVFLRPPSPALLQAMDARGCGIKGSCGIHNGHLRAWCWLAEGEQCAVSTTPGAPALPPGTLHTLTVGTQRLCTLDMPLPAASAWYGLNVIVGKEPLTGSPVVCSPANAARHTGPARQLAGVTIVVPCYDGYAATLSCLASVLASGKRNTTPARLLVVWDHGPDARLLAALQRLAARKKLLLTSTPGNLGFLGSVNYALSLIPDGDVILLNADTLVHGDWIDRLVAVGRLPDAGTVTAMGSDAELCSFPTYRDRGKVRRLQDVARLDEACRRLPAALRVREIPVGVGFCMLLTRRALQKLGGLDGLHLCRGYGEDTDFCLRCAEAGLKNYAACQVYVAHLGGQSFGPAKRALVAQNDRFLFARFPSYEADYERFVREDPLRPVQDAISRLACQAAGDSVLHARPWGEHALITKKKTREASCYALPCGQGLRVVLRVSQELALADMCFVLPQEAAALRRLVEVCGWRSLVVHGPLAWASRLAQSLGLSTSPSTEERPPLPPMVPTPGGTVLLAVPLSLRTWEQCCRCVRHFPETFFLSSSLETLWTTAPRPENWGQLPNVDNLQPLHLTCLAFADTPEFSHQERWRCWLREHHVEELSMTKLPAEVA